MAESQSNVNVIQLPQPLACEAADVLTRAFTGYPMMDYLFGHLGSQEQWIRRVFLLSIQWRIEIGWPALGAESEGKILGVLLGEPPGEPPASPAFDEQFEAFARDAGQEGRRRFEAYEQIKEAHKPEAEHFYITAVGVDTQAQGKGICRLLMEQIHQQADSCGLPAALDTQLASNVKLYKHMGYKVIAEERLGDLPIWFMQRVGAS
jgi:ribosomal protein S18 acetylase RimI-like enzyme